MPNHIINRITLEGNSANVKQLIETFSTSFERKPSKTYDGKIIYVHYETGEPGWFDPSSNLFSRRNKNDNQGIPYGFEAQFDEAWLRFPDFEKIISMPKELNISSDNWLMPLENQFSETTFFKSHLDKMRAEIDKNPAVMEDSLDNFIQGIRNYIQYGHATWHGWSREHWGTKWNSYTCSMVSENVYEFETAWSGVPNLIKIISERFPSVHVHYEYSDEDTGSNCGYVTFIGGRGDVIRLENQSKEAYDLALKLRPSLLEYYHFVDGEWKYIDDDEA